jgi:hypothetical protein
VIDLYAMSLKLYAALGPEKSTQAFVHYPANTFRGQDKPLKDDTHHNAYGGYELARCIVEGIKTNVPALAAHLAKDAGVFDPSKPDSPEKVDIPASPLSGATEEPVGVEGDTVGLIVTRFGPSDVAALILRARTDRLLMVVPPMAAGWF